MVENIRFGFPTGDVAMENPLADAAFAAQIGAKKLISEANDPCSEYELRNAATGTRFTLCWHHSFGGGIGYSSWRLRKWKFIKS